MAFLHPVISKLPTEVEYLCLKNIYIYISFNWSLILFSDARPKHDEVEDIGQQPNHGDQHGVHRESTEEYHQRSRWAPNQR